MKLQSGIEITFDFYKIKRAEFISLAKGVEDDKMFDMLARVTGVERSVFEDLSWQEWREVATAFWEGAYAPLAKSSVSESTGQSSTASDHQETKTES